MSFDAAPATLDFGAPAKTESVAPDVEFVAEPAPADKGGKNSE
jgi:hypothetical protein